MNFLGLFNHGLAGSKLATTIKNIGQLSVIKPKMCKLSSVYRSEGNENSGISLVLFQSHHLYCVSNTYSMAIYVILHL